MDYRLSLSLSIHTGSKCQRSVPSVGFSRFLSSSAVEASGDGDDGRTTTSGFPGACDTHQVFLFAVAYHTERSNHSLKIPEWMSMRAMRAVPRGAPQCVAAPVNLPSCQLRARKRRLSEGCFSCERTNLIHIDG